jgi:hypothetical protein
MCCLGVDAMPLAPQLISYALSAALTSNKSSSFFHTTPPRLTPTPLLAAFRTAGSAPRAANPGRPLLPRPRGDGPTRVPYQSPLHSLFLRAASSLPVLPNPRSILYYSTNLSSNVGSTMNFYFFYLRSFEVLWFFLC